MALTQVQGGMLTSGGISSTQLADSSVTSSKIASGAVGPTNLSGAQSGSAPVYGARAWVNFNGTGTVAIRGSGNVSSITDNGIGDYTINFTTAMADANYCPVCMTQNGDTNGNRGAGGAQIYDDFALTTSNMRIFTAYGSTTSSGGSKNDQAIICVSVFR